MFLILKFLWKRKGENPATTFDEGKFMSENENFHLRHETELEQL